MLNNGYIKKVSTSTPPRFRVNPNYKSRNIRYEAYPDYPAAAAKYEKHTELKDHKPKYDQAKYAAG
jgi:hypothetical protein